MERVLVLLCVVTGIFGIVYVLAMTRHRERIAMIERSIPATLFVGKSANSYTTLKFGMLSMGIGAGILLGNILVNSFGMSAGVSYGSMTFLLGGLSLILNFIIEQRLKKGKENSAD